MNQPKRFPEHLPVLTDFLGTPSAAKNPPASAPTAVEALVLSKLDSSLNLNNMAQRVRANVQIQLDYLLEANLRDAMAPLLAQQTDALVRHLKADMAQVLADIVARAVEQEIINHKI